MSLARIATLFTILAIVPVAAQAQSTTMTGCYVPKTGSVYVVKAEGAPDACKQNHVEFSWQTGGITFTKRVSNAVLVTPNTFEQAFASCEPGETVTGGGYFAYPNVTVSVPVNTPTIGGTHPNAWFVDLRNLSSLDVWMNAVVICAKPTK